ncbi:MAG: hypothetical protein AB1467_05120 [Candidatus Diapherotrites archaeon]
MDKKLDKFQTTTILKMTGTFSVPIELIQIKEKSEPKYRLVPKTEIRKSRREALIREAGAKIAKHKNPKRVHRELRRKGILAPIHKIRWH